jgi:hypothetical protein
MPQPGKGDPNIGRWPKVPAPDYPGRYRVWKAQSNSGQRAAQNAEPTLMDLIDSGRLRLNAANWQRMLSDPALIALGQSPCRGSSDTIGLRPIGYSPRSTEPRMSCHSNSAMTPSVGRGPP